MKPKKSIPKAPAVPKPKMNPMPAVGKAPPMMKLKMGGKVKGC